MRLPEEYEKKAPRVPPPRTSGMPFELLPYQCFQEARKILKEDRADKIRQILAETEKIERLEAADPAQFRDGDAFKQKRLRSLRSHVEELKILADINDPMVKARFDAGKGNRQAPFVYFRRKFPIRQAANHYFKLSNPGDMNKPIYRYLARKRWQGYARKVIAQRIEQFSIVPDVLPKLEPNMAIQLFFRQYLAQPGDIIPSIMSTVPPRLRVQVFDKGERLVTVVVMDSDVPNPETDGFDRRCHFLAANIPLSPTITNISLEAAQQDGAAAVPWLPPTAQKGAPYHRLSVVVLEQKPGQTLDAKRLRDLYADRNGFSMRSFRDKFDLEPVGFTMFRSLWDDDTDRVMRKFAIPGADVEYKRVHVPSLKPPRKARGWEAKRQGPKYRHLWKYTRRINTPKRKFVR